MIPCAYIIPRSIFLDTNTSAEVCTRGNAASVDQALSQDH